MGLRGQEVGGVRVALFVTCLVDGLFPQVGRATVRLLERLGVRVEVPLGQTCCGQMHVNGGYPGLALPLVRNHMAALDGYQAVVAPSGSWVAAVRHQHAEVARQFGDPGLAGWPGRRRSWPGGRTSCPSSSSTRVRRARPAHIQPVPEA
jgi:Fe-S oxidoreductase